MPQIDKNSTSGKTYKREVAVGMLSVWAVATMKLFGWTAADMAAALATPYAAMTYATFGFAAAAYGMEWARKQMNGRFTAKPSVDPSNDGIE